LLFFARFDIHLVQLAGVRLRCPERLSVRIQIQCKEQSRILEISFDDRARTIEPNDLTAGRNKNAAVGQNAESVFHSAAGIAEVRKLFAGFGVETLYLLPFGGVEDRLPIGGEIDPIRAAAFRIRAVSSNQIPGRTQLLDDGFGAPVLSGAHEKVARGVDDDRLGIVLEAAAKVALIDQR
jgi:hypothetical protein